MSEGLDAFEMVKGPHRLKGSLMKGVAAALLMEGVGPVVLMTPNIDKLHKAFERITNSPLIEEQCIFALGSSGQFKRNESFENMVNKILEEEPKQFKKLCWYYHPETYCCFIEYENSKANDLCSSLGEAVKQTERECKQLMSKVLGLSMKEINNIKISTELPIPF